MRGQVGRPRKSASAAGNGLPRSVESARSSFAASTEDLSPSAKKKRKARKKPLVSIVGAPSSPQLTAQSEEIVASASDSGEGAQEPNGTLAEATEASIATVSGRRKSSTRKAKKKPIVSMDACKRMSLY